MKKTLYTVTLVLSLSLSSVLVYTMSLLPSSHAKSDTTSTMQSDKGPAAIIYMRNCASCHDRGIMSAPKPGAPRLQEDIDILVENTIKGIGRMPARGHASFLSEDEVRSVVEYMSAPQ